MLEEKRVEQAVQQAMKEINDAHGKKYITYRSKNIYSTWPHNLIAAVIHARVTEHIQFTISTEPSNQYISVTSGGFLLSQSTDIGSVSKDDIVGGYAFTLSLTNGHVLIFTLMHESHDGNADGRSQNPPDLSPELDRDLNKQFLNAESYIQCMHSSIHKTLRYLAVKQADIVLREFGSLPHSTKRMEVTLTLRLKDGEHTVVIPNALNGAEVLYFVDPENERYMLESDITRSVQVASSLLDRRYTIKHRFEYITAEN